MEAVCDILEFRGKYRFLSNFHPVEADYAGIVFPTLEHAFQAAKTTVRTEQFRIAECKTPGEAKRFGRTVTLRQDWEYIKVYVMASLLRRKFSCYHLQDLLLDTGNAMLVEGNDWGDTFWGVCKGRGQNVLGCLLMTIRDDLREQNQEHGKETRKIKQSERNNA